MFIVPLQHNSDRATLLDGNCTYCVSAKFKAFSFPDNNSVFPLFCIPRLTDSPPWGHQLLRELRIMLLNPQRS